MKKLLVSLFILVMAGVSFAADKTKAADQGQKAAVTAPSQNEQNPFQYSWQWTKARAKDVGQKTTSVLGTAWDWTKQKGQLVGTGFKKGGEALYDTVKDGSKKSSSTEDKASSAKTLASDKADVKGKN